MTFMMLNTKKEPFDPVEFRFWYPPEGKKLTIGADKKKIYVPQIPLPIRSADMSDSSDPSEKTIGDGIYEYLCHFSFCRHAAEYAKILQQDYPFLISDINAQLVLLDVKAVESSGLQRKIALLKILHHLNPDNFELLHKIGIAHFDLGLDYSELDHVVQQMKEARSWLEKARRQAPDDLKNLNYLGQVCYFNGDYHQAKLYWQMVVDKLEAGEAKDELVVILERIISGDIPEQFMVESLETVGAAMEYFNLEEYQDACDIMEKLVEAGSLPRELPSPDFFYLLGRCREKCKNLSGAFESFSIAEELDKNYAAARQALERVMQVSARS
jgi:tetratricopeptide (TPR) repeat protein